MQPVFSPMIVKMKDKVKREQYLQMKEHKYIIQVTNKIERRVVEEHADVFLSSNKRGISPGLSANTSHSVDQALIIYTSSKMMNNRSILPKLQNEPAAIDSYQNYKENLKYNKKVDPLQA